MFSLSKWDSKGGSSAKRTHSQLNDYRRQRYLALAFCFGLFEGLKMKKAM